MAVAAGTGFLAAGSPLTGLFHGAAAAGDVLRGALRLGVAVLGHLIYATAFAIVGYVAMFAVFKSQGY